MQTIETKRLMVRNFATADWQALHEMITRYQTSELAAYDRPWPTSPDEIKKVTEWFASGESFFAISLKESGQFIGLVSLNREEEASRDYDLGYVFHFAYRGKGYAIEACRDVIGHAFGRLHAERVLAGTAAANGASCRLLEKLGFKRTSEAVTFFRNSPDGKPIEFLGYRYSLLKESWVSENQGHLFPVDKLPNASIGHQSRVLRQTPFEQLGRGKARSHSKMRARSRS